MIVFKCTARLGLLNGVQSGSASRRLNAMAVHPLAPWTGKQVRRVINQNGHGMDGLIKPIAIDLCRVLLSARASAGSERGQGGDDASLVRKGCSSTHAGGRIARLGRGGGA
jgi:hypothetical protein